MTTNSVTSTTRPDQRLGQKYRFDDPDMDLFFVAALGWAPAGGLDVGQAFHVASKIEEGNADSWVREFGAYGDEMNAQADRWKQRGWTQNAGEMRLKAFASYRSAWQFAPLGETFRSLYAKHKSAFAMAMNELSLPATFFQVPYKGKGLPGVFLQHEDKDAPVVLIIGGSDTCFEDLFLTAGRNMFDRGYSVACVDIPGQGTLPDSQLYWEVEAEKPISAIVDVLIEQFGAATGHIALMGLSLGGYFVTRAAGHESRLAGVIASTPFPMPGKLFAQSVSAGLARMSQGAVSDAAKRNWQILMWKAGVRTPQELVERTASMTSDPSIVTVPFLSIVGTGDSPVFQAQAKGWHESIRSTRKDLVVLDSATGANGHCQVNARSRLAQEATGWLSEIL